MKKVLLLLLMSIVLISCSNESKEDAEKQKGRVTLDISAVKSFMAKERSGEVLSYEEKQNVSYVMLYIYKFDGSQFVYTGTSTEITQWVLGTTSTSYAVDPELPVGVYKFVVIGLRKSGDYSLDQGDLFGDFHSKVHTGVGDAKELFSGYSGEVDITAAGGRATIQMTRKVAGVMGYFKNVPEKINTKTVKYLTLTISKYQAAFNPVTGVQLFADQGEQKIINIDLSTQKVVNGIYEGNDLSSAGVIKLPQSQLDGTYLLPSESSYMILSLRDEANNPLREWKITNEKGEFEYPIEANHLYAIGTKKTNANNDPKDEALDLMQGQAINITISTAWSLIHDLNLN